MAKISITKEKFLEALATSRVLSQPILDDIQERFSHQMDPGRIARALIGEGRLTEWQAKALLTGRTRLTLGKYILQDQIGRDQLGDRFVAQHVSLDRRVELQILPAALAEDPTKTAAFMQQVQQASMLDHPHLIHVYDIDKDSGRYYVVVEHVEGKYASEVELDELSDLNVGILLDQALSGICVAHEHGIVHGDLNLKNLLLHNHNDLRIMDMALSILRRQLNEEGELKEPRLPSPEQDFRDIGKAAIELIKRSQRGRSAGSLLALATNLSRIENVDGVDAIINQLKDWLKDNPALPSRIIEKLEDESRDGVPSSRIASEATQVGSRATGTSEPTPSTSRHATKPTLRAKSGTGRKPGKGIWIGLSAVVMTLLFVSGYFVLQAFNAESSRPGASDPPTNRKVADGTNGVEPSSKSTQADSEVTRQSETQAQADANSSQEATHAKTDGKADDNGSSELETDPLGPQRETADLEELKGASGIESEPPDALGATTGTRDSDRIGDTDLESAAADFSSELDQLSVMQGVGIRREVFAGFPDTIALPPLDADSTDEAIILAELYPENAKIDSMILITRQDDVSLGSQLAIRDSGADQRWIVDLETSSGVVNVAELVFDAPKLSFQWLAAAKSNLDCNYLRNCRLQVLADGKTKAAGLRHPIVLEPMVIEGRRFSSSLTGEIPWMPVPKALAVEIQLESNEEFPDVYVINEAESAESSGRSSKAGDLRIAFDKIEDNRFLWLNVKPEFRKNRFALKAQMYVQPFVQRPVDHEIYQIVLDRNIQNAVLYRPSDFTATFNQVANFREYINGIYTQRKHLYDTRVITTGRRDYADLNKKISEMIAQIDTSLESLEIQKGIAQELVGVPIPIRIIYRLNDNDVLVLARASTTRGGVAPWINLDVAGNAGRAKNVLKNSELQGEKGEFVDWEFEFSRGGSRNNQFVLERSNNELVIHAYDAIGSMTQAGISQANVGGSRFGTSQVRFNIYWEDSSSSKSSAIWVLVNDVKVFELKTPDGDATTAVTPSALNGSAVTVPNNQIVQKDVTEVRIDLPPSIQMIETFQLMWITGNDKLKVDDIELLVVSETGYVSNYSNDQQMAAIVNDDCLVVDLDSSLLDRATIVLTNPQMGDGFAIAGKTIPEETPMGIDGTLLECSLVRGDAQIVVEIVGPGPPVQFALALKAIQFTTDDHSPNRDDRYIDISVFDQGSNQGTASSIITFDEYQP